MKLKSLQITEQIKKQNAFLYDAAALISFILKFSSLRDTCSLICQMNAH